MADEGNKILDGITEEQWKDIYRDLLGYAVFLLSLYNIKFDTQGLNASDFVGRVVAKVLDIDGDSHRVWDPKKNPDKVAFFKGCISSEISNHLVSSRVTTSVDVDIDHDFDFFASIGVDSMILNEVDTKMFKDKLIDDLLEIDEQLVEVLFCLEEDLSVEKIAKNLNFKNPRQVRYAISKIRDATGTLSRKLNKSNHD